MSQQEQGTLQGCVLAAEKYTGLSSRFRVLRDCKRGSSNQWGCTFEANLIIVTLNPH